MATVYDVYLNQSVVVPDDIVPRLKGPDQPDDPVIASTTRFWDAELEVTDYVTANAALYAAMAARSTPKPAVAFRAPA